MKAELQRRQSLAEALEAFLRARPNAWIAAVAFEPFGRQAWRTRLSEVRQRVEAEGDAVKAENVKPVSRSRALATPRRAGSTAFTTR